MSFWPDLTFQKPLSPGDLENEFLPASTLLRTNAESLLKSGIETPMLLRFTVYQDAAVYNALTAFTPQGLPFYCISGSLPFANRLSGPSSNTRAKNTAVLTAFLRVSEHVKPGLDSPLSRPLSNILLQLGLDPEYRSLSNLSDPRDIGNGRQNPTQNGKISNPCFLSSGSSLC